MELKELDLVLVDVRKDDAPVFFCDDSVQEFNKGILVFDIKFILKEGEV